MLFWLSAILLHSLCLLQNLVVHQILVASEPDAFRTDHCWSVCYIPAKHTVYAVRSAYDRSQLNADIADCRALFLYQKHVLKSGY
jgi:hypothetical protein